MFGMEKKKEWEYRIFFHKLEEKRPPSNLTINKTGQELVFFS